MGTLIDILHTPGASDAPEFRQRRWARVAKLRGAARAKTVKSRVKRWYANRAD